MNLEDFEDGDIEAVYPEHDDFDEDEREEQRRDEKRGLYLEHQDDCN